MSDLIKMTDEIVKAMAAIRQIAKVFKDSECDVEFNAKSATFNITPVREVVPPGVMEDIKWLKTTIINYRSYEHKFQDADFTVTEYSTWGNPFMSDKGIGIWRAADKGDVDFSLVFKENKTYPIAQRYNPDMFGDSPNEAYISDEYGVIHRVIRA